MKTLFKSINLTLAFLIAAIGAFFIGSVIAPAIDVSPLALGTGIFSVGMMAPTLMPNVLLDALTLTEIFAGEITENFYKDNAFITKSKDDTAFVMDGKTVHLPQRGARPTIKRNRTSLPARITKRVDTEVTYTLDELTIDPIHIGSTEEVEISYPKIETLREDILAELSESVANYTLNDWLPDGATVGVEPEVLFSTGATRTNTYGATAKAITEADIIKARKQLNLWNTPQAGRMMVIPADYESDILKIDGFIDADKIGTANRIEGQIGRVYGFDVFVRSTVGRYSATGATKRVYNDDGNFPTTAATDRECAMFWSSRFVRRAMGSVELFVNEKDATNYGTILSGLIRYGARQAREDKQGVIALIEG